jgi:hypothetical protein
MDEYLRGDVLTRLATSDTWCRYRRREPQASFSAKVLPVPTLFILSLIEVINFSESEIQDSPLRL